ncbi:MAG: hypothetical protein ABDH28_00570 [Brevinematia bacterium]
MRKVFALLMILFCLSGYAGVTKDEAIFILKNHKERGFYFEGEVSRDTLKVVVDLQVGSEKVFINFADGKMTKVVSFYSTVLVLDKRPSHEFMEHLLRANNFNESLGFFYLYYDISLDKWFVDYCVRIREEDLTKFSLISLIRAVSLYTASSRKELVKRFSPNY